RSVERPWDADKVTRARADGGRRRRVAIGQRCIELDRLTIDEGRHADGSDSDTGFGRLAALTEPACKVLREQLDQCKHVVDALQAGAIGDDRGRDELVAVAHVELEAMLDRIGWQALTEQVGT